MFILMLEVGPGQIAQTELHQDVAHALQVVATARLQASVDIDGGIGGGSYEACAHLERDVSL